MIELINVEKRFGNKRVLRNINLKLQEGKVYGLFGPNGVGKTTLLKTILGQIKPLSGTVELGEFLEPGYFAQEEREKNDDTALDDVWNEYPGMSNYEVRAALAACGLTNEHITSKVFVLSGGEAAKVRLCKLMLKNINWLILDEPTNHLDADSREMLESGTQTCPYCFQRQHTVGIA